MDAIFENYRDAGDPVNIGPEGIERLCADLSVSPTDRRVLILAYVMNASRMGFFSHDEFTAGCRFLGATTLAALKKALPRLDAAVAAPDAFSDFHSFAFRFMLTEPGQKIVDVESAAQMLELVMPSGRFVPQFCAFLRGQAAYKTLNLDQWHSFLRFSAEVKEDLSNAGDNPSWPVLLDNFAEHELARAAAAAGGAES